MISEIGFWSVVILFQSEQEAWRADDDEIDERHLEWSERITKVQKDKDDAEKRGEDSFVQKKSATSCDVVDGLTAFVDCGRKDGKIVFEKNDIGGFSSGVGASAN